MATIINIQAYKAEKLVNALIKAALYAANVEKREIIMYVNDNTKPKGVA